MSGIEHEINPVSHLTTGVIGPPGKRVFYIQGRSDEKTITLIVEKQQVQSLAVGLEQFLSELQERFPELPTAASNFVETEMELEQPVDPIFRVGHMGLGYDEDSDMLVLVARELQAPDEDPELASAVRFWCTRSQMRRMCLWGLELANRGRPICGNCGEPIDADGHFCPKRNGHKH